MGRQQGLGHKEVMFPGSWLPLSFGAWSQFSPGEPEMEFLGGSFQGNQGRRASRQRAPRGHPPSACHGRAVRPRGRPARCCRRSAPQPLPARGPSLTGTKGQPRCPPVNPPASPRGPERGRPAASSPALSGPAARDEDGTSPRRAWQPPTRRRRGGTGLRGDGGGTRLPPPLPGAGAGSGGAGGAVLQHHGTCRRRCPGRAAGPGRAASGRRGRGGAGRARRRRAARLLKVLAARPKMATD